MNSSKRGAVYGFKLQSLDMVSRTWTSILLSICCLTFVELTVVKLLVELISFMRVGGCLCECKLQTTFRYRVIGLVFTNGWFAIWVNCKFAWLLFYNSGYFMLIFICSCAIQRQVTRRWRCYTLLSKQSEKSFLMSQILTRNWNTLRKLPQVVHVDVSFSLGSVSTLFRWDGHFCHVCVKRFFLLTTVQKL